jgi:hypothetical protein
MCVDPFPTTVLESHISKLCLSLWQMDFISEVLIEHGLMLKTVLEIKYPISTYPSIVCGERTNFTVSETCDGYLN